MTSTTRFLATALLFQGAACIALLDTEAVSLRLMPVPETEGEPVADAPEPEPLFAGRADSVEQAVEMLASIGVTPVPGNEAGIFFEPADWVEKDEEVPGPVEGDTDADAGADTSGTATGGDGTEAASGTSDTTENETGAG